MSRGGSPPALEPHSGWGASVSADRPDPGASGPRCSLAAARWRLSSAKVWWALVRPRLWPRLSGATLSGGLSW